MKPYIWLLALSFLIIGESNATSLPRALAADQTQVSNPSSSNTKKKDPLFSSVKRKLLKQWLLPPIASKESDGHVLSAVSFALGIGLLACWVVSPLIGWAVSVPIGLAGLIMGIKGLKRARRWNGNKRTRTFAIIGIVLNGLGIIAAITLLVLFAMAFGG